MLEQDLEKLDPAKDVLLWAETLVGLLFLAGIFSEATLVGLLFLAVIVLGATLEEPLFLAAI